MNGYKIQRVKGIDENRYDCRTEDIVKFYSDLKKEVEGVPVGFVFNLDESGQNTFVDSRNLYVIVPKDKDVRNFPLNRSIRRITLLHCISTDGTTAPPMIVVPRLTIDDEIFDIIPTGEVLFVSQEKGYCKYELFTLSFKDYFLPYLITKQDKYQYT